MKMFVAFLALFAGVCQYGQAIPSNFSQSLNVVQAIIDSPLVPEAITQNEYVIEIERETKSLSRTTVFYEITTEVPTDTDEECGNARKHHRHYQVKVVLTPNPLIGPQIITVESVTRVHEHH